jgi:hypothetical protein
LPHHGRHVSKRRQHRQAHSSSLRLTVGPEPR